MKIILYHGTGWIQRLVMFASRGSYSHASVGLNDGSIIEACATEGVTRKKCLTYKKKKCKMDVFEVPTTPEQDAIIEKFLVSQIGKKYDWLAILGFVIHTTKEGRKQYARWICSELVFAAFQKASITLLSGIDAWRVSPTILSYNTIMTKKETIKV